MNLSLFTIIEKCQIIPVKLEENESWYIHFIKGLAYKLSIDLHKGKPENITVEELQRIEKDLHFRFSQALPSLLASQQLYTTDMFLMLTQSTVIPKLTLWQKIKLLFL
jgi:hypothetical protein